MTHPFRFYAIVLPGLEPIAVRELEKLSAHEIRRDHGGVHFAGTMETMFRVNLRSRCITRVLMRLRRFTVMSLEMLHQELGHIDWHRVLQSDVSVSVQVSCSSSRLMHTSNIEDEVLKVLQQRKFKLTKSSDNRQQIFIRIDNNRCTISIDTSGERLDRRGYRLESGKAPIRETLAAGILQWMDWQPDEPLIVPMCGSGTFAIEAAMAAHKIASNQEHDFPFFNWPSLQQKKWQRILDKTLNMQQDDITLDIQASDIHAGAIGIAERNAKRAGVSSIVFQQADIDQLYPAKETTSPGLIVCNPPYGERIQGGVKACYREVAALFKRYPGFRMAVLSPNQSLEKALDLEIDRRLCVTHGGKSIHVLSVDKVQP